VSALDTWQKTCCYLYLPRLRDAETLRATVNAGVSSRDFFGVAYGREEERFQGFHFSENTTVIFDDSLLLIEPKAAAEFASKLTQEAAEREAAIKGRESGEGAGGGASGGSGSGSGAAGGSTGSGTGTGTGTGSGGSTTGGGGGATGSGSGAGVTSKKTTFFGTVDLNPNQAKVQFSDVADELLMLLNRSGVKLRISVEIEAELPAGFDDGVQRSVRENCNQLKFKNHEFGDHEAIQSARSELPFRRRQWGSGYLLYCEFACNSPHGKVCWAYASVIESACEDDSGHTRSMSIQIHENRNNSNGRQRLAHRLAARTRRIAGQVACQSVAPLKSRAPSLWLRQPVN
jgi:hypothetical protein